MQTKKVQNLAPTLHIMSVCNFLSILLLLLKPVPEISALFFENGKTLPPPLHFLARVSEFIRQYWWGLLAVAAVLYVVGRPRIKPLSGQKATPIAASILGLLVLVAGIVAYALIHPLFEIGKV